VRKLQSWISFVTVIVVIFAWFPASWSEDEQKININTASADELVQLKGVGEKKAKTIIEFRKNNGPFKVPEDLIKVPGIGPKTFDANKDRITVK
jgi:competence ComEA-like helix-hairpin-helix protein